MDQYELLYVFSPYPVAFGLSFLAKSPSARQILRIGSMTIMLSYAVTLALLTGCIDDKMSYSHCTMLSDPIAKVVGSINLLLILQHFVVAPALAVLSLFFEVQVRSK